MASQVASVATFVAVTGPGAIEKYDSAIFATRSKLRKTNDQALAILAILDAYGNLLTAKEMEMINSSYERIMEQMNYVITLKEGGLEEPPTKPFDMHKPIESLRSTGMYRKIVKIAENRSAAQQMLQDARRAHMKAQRTSNKYRHWTNMQKAKQKRMEEEAASSQSGQTQATVPQATTYPPSSLPVETTLSAISLLHRLPGTPSVNTPRPRALQPSSVAAASLNSESTAAVQLEPGVESDAVKPETEPIGHEDGGDGGDDNSLERCQTTDTLNSLSAAPLSHD